MSSEMESQFFGAGALVNGCKWWLGGGGLANGIRVGLETISVSRQQRRVLSRLCSSYTVITKVFVYFIVDLATP